MSEPSVSSWLLLFGLAVAWAVVLVPDFVRRNAASRRSDTIGQFARNLGALGQSQPVGARRPANVVQFPQVQRYAEPTYEPAVDLRGPRPVVARTAARPAPRPAARTRAQQRRKDVLAALVAAAVLTFLGSLSVGGAFVIVNAVTLVALGAYVAAFALVTRKEKLRSQVGQLYSPQFRGVAPAYVDHRQRVAR